MTTCGARNCGHSPAVWLLPMAVLLTLSTFAEPVITEFMADNERAIEDEDGSTSDWIELFNPTGTLVNLAGWSLTDDSSEMTKWTFTSGEGAYWCGLVLVPIQVITSTSVIWLIVAPRKIAPIGAACRKFPLCLRGESHFDTLFYHFALFA